jgi:hypothetical protein
MIGWIDKDCLDIAAILKPTVGVVVTVFAHKSITVDKIVYDPGFPYLSGDSRYEDVSTSQNP